MWRTVVFALFSAALGLVIISCQGIGSPGSKPVVIIASPPSGSLYTIGEKVVVQSVSTDSSGIVRVALLADGTLVREDPSPVTQGQAQFSLIQEWTANIAGQHTLTVRATNAQGATSESAILVNVREQSVIEPTLISAIATAVPLATFTPTKPVSAAPTEIATTNPAVTVIVTATSPPANTPEPTQAPPCANNSKFVADLTIPDGTNFTPNAVFNKSWRVLNNGSCAWENYSLVFVSGTQMAAGSIFPVPPTQPGATADLLVPMTAPASYGAYKGTWRLRDVNGKIFGTDLTVVINVPAPATTVPPTHTPPPTIAGCSGQPNDFQFNVSANNITAGQAVTLNWSAVSNASAVYLSGGDFGPEPGQGVETPGNRTTTPGATTTYKLKAICDNSGQTREKTVNVTVNAAVGNFAGEWVINFGNMNLTQSGASVTGTYNQLFYGTSGTIAGTVTGNKLVGTWSISGNSGAMELNLIGGGNRIDGNWNGTQKWCGARPSQNFPNGCSYAGAWRAKVGNVFPNCAMTLQRHDNIITGNYCNGTLQGVITYNGTDTVATGNWDTGSSIGAFTFFLDGFNALHFRGNYDGAFQWCGWRDGQTAPTPCQVP